MPTLDYFEIERLPTLAVGQAANLKIDTGTMRVWVSRCGSRDGETQPIQVERLIDGRWVDVTGGERPGYSIDHVIDGGELKGLTVHCLNRLLNI